MNVEGEGMPGAFRGHLLGKRMGLSKICHIISHGGQRRRSTIQRLTPGKARPPSAVYGVVTVQQSEEAGEFTIVDTGIIQQQAQMIPEVNRCWRINSWIDMTTFNVIY